MRPPITESEFLEALTNTIPVESVDLKSYDISKEERGHYSYDIMFRGDNYGDLYVIRIKSVKSRDVLITALENISKAGLLSQRFVEWWRSNRQKDVFVKISAHAQNP